MVVDPGCLNPFYTVLPLLFNQFPLLTYSLDFYSNMNRSDFNVCHGHAADIN